MCVVCLLFPLSLYIYISLSISLSLSLFSLSLSIYSACVSFFLSLSLSLSFSPAFLSLLFLCTRVSGSPPMDFLCTHDGLCVLAHGMSHEHAHVSHPTTLQSHHQSSLHTQPTQIAPEHECPVKSYQFCSYEERLYGLLSSS